MPRRTIAAMTGRELIKKLDAEFSLYVRLNEADDSGCITCPTCGRTYKYNEGIDLPTSTAGRTTTCGGTSGT